MRVRKNRASRESGHRFPVRLRVDRLRAFENQLETFRKGKDRGDTINWLFTRVVNHCVTVEGTGTGESDAIPESLSPQSRLDPTLNVEHEPGRDRKTTLVQHLTPIRA